MPDKELRTSLVLEAKTKGFENAQKRAEKLRDALSAPTVAGAFGKLDKNLVAVEKAFAKITVHLEKMDRAMRKFEKSIDVLSRRMRQVGAPVGVGAPGAPAPAPLGPLGPLGGGVPGGPTGAAPPVSNPSTPGTGTAPPVGPYSTRGLYFPRSPMGPELPPGWHVNRYTGGAQRDLSPWVQGMFQGARLGEYIPRDQGIRPMLQQTGGRFIGSSLRGLASGALALASAPFTGIEGLSTAFASVPGGGVIAGQLNTAMSNAQAALAAQRAEMSLAPFVSIRGASQAAQARAKRIMSEQFKPEPTPLVTAASRMTPEIAARTHLPAGQQSRDDVEIHNLIERAQASREGRAARLQSFETVDAQQLQEEQRRVSARNDRNRARFERDRAARAQAALRVDLFAGVEAGGRSLMGVGRQEAIEFTGQLLRAGGGTLEGARDQHMIRASMAAHTAYGVDAATSGAFFRAGREGGMVGGGLGGDLLARAIGDARRAGLEGEDAVEYLREIAQAQNEFRTTGIPVNSQSLSRLSQTVALSGLGVMRGAAVAQQVTGAAKRIARTGPQSAADFLLMRTLGGFRGGGLKQYEDALEKLETGEYDDASFRDLVKGALRAGGTEEGGRFTLRSAFDKLGVNLGVGESKALQRLSLGKETAEDQKYIASVKERLAAGAKNAPETTKDLGARAREMLGNIGYNLSRQAELDNERLRLGKTFIGTMQDLEKNTHNVQAAFRAFAPELDKIVKFMNSISEAFPGLAKKFRETVGLDKPTQQSAPAKPKGGT